MLRKDKPKQRKSVNITQRPDEFTHHQGMIDGQTIESILRESRRGSKRTKPAANSKTCPAGMSYDMLCSGNLKKSSIYQYPCRAIIDGDIRCYDTDGEYFVVPRYILRSRPGQASQGDQFNQAEQDVEYVQAAQYAQVPQSLQSRQSIEQSAKNNYRQSLNMYLMFNPSLLKPLIRVYTSVDKMINEILKNTLKKDLPKGEGLEVGEKLFAILNKIKEAEVQRMHLKEIQLAESILKRQQDEKAYRASIRVRPIPRPRPQILPYPVLAGFKPNSAQLKQRKD